MHKCIIRRSGHIPEGSVCAELADTIDLLPTFAYLANAKLPEHIIDGKNIWPLMSGDTTAKSPHEYFCFYWGNHLQAIRSSKWKLHFPHAYRSLKGKPGRGGTLGPAPTSSKKPTWLCTIWLRISRSRKTWQKTILKWRPHYKSMRDSSDWILVTKSSKVKIRGNQAS